MKLNFSILLVIHRRNTFTQFFQMGVVRQVWAWSECCQMVSQLHIKNELSYEVDKYIYLIFYNDIGVARKNFFLGGGGVRGVRDF